MEAMNYLCYMTSLITDIHTTVIRLTSVIFILKEWNEIILGIHVGSG